MFHPKRISFIPFLRILLFPIKSIFSKCSLHHLPLILRKGQSKWLINVQSSSDYSYTQPWNVPCWVLRTNCANAHNGKLDKKENVFCLYCRNTKIYTSVSQLFQKYFPWVAKQIGLLPQHFSKINRSESFIIHVKISKAVLIIAI